MAPCPEDELSQQRELVLLRQPRDQSWAPIGPGHRVRWSPQDKQNGGWTMKQNHSGAQARGARSKGGRLRLKTNCSRSPMALVALLSLVHVAGGVGNAQSQLAQPSVPKATVERLLRVGKALPGRVELKLTLGEPADPLGDFLPRDARFVAGVSWESGALALLEMRLPQEEIRDQLLAAVSNTQLSLILPQGYGFVASPEGFPVVFCQGAERRLRVWLVDGGEQASADEPADLALLYTEGASACPEARSRAARASVLPILVAPPNVEVTRGGSTSSSGESESQHVTLSSSLTPTELVRHFALGMEEQSWQPNVPVELESFAMQTFTAYVLDEATARTFAWHATLTVRRVANVRMRSGRITVEKLGPVDE